MRIAIALLMVLPWLLAAGPMTISIKGRSEHPTVYLDRGDIERAKRNRETAWGKIAAEKLLKEADAWADKSDERIRGYVPEANSCYAYGFSGCPICQGKIGTWGAGACSLEDPGHVKCVN